MWLIKMKYFYVILNDDTVLPDDKVNDFLGVLLLLLDNL